MGTRDPRAPAHWLAVIAFTISCAWAQQPDSLKREAWSFIDGRANVFADANQTIWSAAETSLEELESAQTLQKLLADGGFEVEAGVAGNSKLPLRYWSIQSGRVTANSGVKR